MQKRDVQKYTTPRTGPLSYVSVASEYYDARRHPTCANFRAASAVYIRRALDKIPGNRTVVDVGAGRSLVAELLIEKGRSVSGLILLDGSIQMLAHSVEFVRSGAQAVIGDASGLPLLSASISVIIASLGDPFNTQEFWDEAARCLMPGGACIFTSPSYEWAQSFRNASVKEREGFAFFELINGNSAYVPSLVRSMPHQIGMIELKRQQLMPTLCHLLVQKRSWRRAELSPGSLR
jgi:SAM-dependent methyltransferase